MTNIPRPKRRPRQVSVEQYDETNNTDYDRDEAHLALDAIGSNRVQTAKPGLLSQVVTVIVMLYICVTTFIATPYYNWQYANQHGFWSWIAFGEVVPTFRALVWPYSMYSDNIEAHKQAEDKKALDTYLRLSDQISAQHQQLDKENAVAFGRMKELLKTDRVAALNAFVDALTRTADSSQQSIQIMESMKPPQPYQELHAATLAGTHGELVIVREAIADARSGKFTEFAKTMDRLTQYDHDWQGRMEAAKAKFEGQQ